MPSLFFKHIDGRVIIMEPWMKIISPNGLEHNCCQTYLITRSLLWRMRHTTTCFLKMVSLHYRAKNAFCNNGGCGSFATTPRTLISVSPCVLCCHQSFPPAISCNVGRAVGISENFVR